MHCSRKGSRDIEHIGSAHDDVERELLKTVAHQRLAAGQGERDLELDTPPQAGRPLPITASRMGHLWDTLAIAYDRLGFADAAGGDEVFQQVSEQLVDHETPSLWSMAPDGLTPTGLGLTEVLRSLEGRLLRARMQDRQALSLAH